MSVCLGVFFGWRMGSEMWILGREMEDVANEVWWGAIHVGNENKVKICNII